MPLSLHHAYALLIGVGANRVPELALPAVTSDIRQLHDVLVHPDRAAYPTDNVLRVTGEEATRANIFAGIDWLGDRLRADQGRDTTAFVYFSGHGHLEDGVHHLVPFDVDPGDVAGTAILAAEFADALAGMRPQRLLAALDCCHAAAVGAKGDAGVGLSPAAVTPDTKGVANLVSRAGRAVLSSSRGTELSWVRQDGTMSVFTYHLVEALCGHATAPHEPTVLVSDAISHVARRVTETVRRERQAEQVPVFRLEGEAFPVSLVLGGRGAAKGQLPDPAERLAPKVTGRVIADVVEGRAAGVRAKRIQGGSDVDGSVEAGTVGKDGDAIGVEAGDIGT